MLGMNQVSWRLGFPLFVGHTCNVAGMTLMHWQMLAQSCRAWSLNDLHMQQSKPGRGAFLCPWDPLPSLLYLPPFQDTLLQTEKNPLPSGTVLIKERHCHFRALFTIFSPWRGSMQPQRRSPHWGSAKKPGNTFSVYFTGSFFKIIYLKCIRGEDNLRTHPENSKRLLGI